MLQASSFTYEETEAQKGQMTSLRDQGLRITRAIFAHH